MGIFLPPDGRIVPTSHPGRKIRLKQFASGGWNLIQ
jgi:hypothetical protein